MLYLFNFIIVSGENVCLYLYRAPEYSNMKQNFDVQNRNLTLKGLHRVRLWPVPLHISLPSHATWTSTYLHRSWP